jgi:hypothetical protein
MSTTRPSSSIGTTATASGCSTISRGCTSPSGMRTWSMRTRESRPS